MCQSPGTGDEEDASASLVAASSYLDMLTDGRRNLAYRLALEAVVQPEHTVLDIGTGTGLLAMLAAGSVAAARNVDCGNAAEYTGTPVQACELFPPMANLARAIIKDNGLDNMVKVDQGNTVRGTRMSFVAITLADSAVLTGGAEAL